MAKTHKDKDRKDWSDYRAQEKGTIRKKWGSQVPVAIVFPNSYHVGMSNLAVHMLYTTFNERDDIICERFFYEEGRPLLSFENSRPLTDFTLVFFTLSFELDYPNIIRILEGSSIPAFAQDRSAGCPIIIAGGICVIANPEPVSPFFDLMLLGDIEATIPPFMDRFRELRDLQRENVLRALGAFPFAYDPALLSVDYHDSGQVKSFVPEDFSVHVEFYRGKCLGMSAITSPNTEFGSMVLVEGARGCPSRCSFCLLGNLYRFQSENIDGLPDNTRDVGIIGGGISYHPRIVEIIEALRSRGITVHLPSLRLDEIPLSLIELIKDDIKTLTFGIEAAAEPLRTLLGKSIGDDQIISRIAAIMAMKSFNLKLYFMIGLPGEDLEDVDAIPELVKRIRHVMIKQGAPRGSLGNITVHASPFIPKAATPFQWLPMADMEDLKNKVARLRHAFRKIDNTVFTHDSVKFSFLQAVLSRGDRRVADTVIRLARGENLPKILRESSVNLNFYALRQRPEDEVLPWDFIEGLTPKEKLLTRLQSRQPAHQQRE
ncbi:MAG: hypothetical protein ABFD12_05580 [Syntrophorhabdus sp.]